MSLSIDVGRLARLLAGEVAAEPLRADLRAVSALLVEEGLSPHDEPEALPELRSRAHMTSIPYDWLHRLRRAAARWRNDPAWRWTPSVRAHEDPILGKEASRFRMHLVCHSDAEGFYVPVAFDDLPCSRAVRGGLLGSTPRLRAELLTVAPQLAIGLEAGRLPDAVAAAVNTEDIAAPLAAERRAWLALFEACELSLAHGSVIVFS